MSETGKTGFLMSGPICFNGEMKIKAYVDTHLKKGYAMVYGLKLQALLSDVNMCGYAI